MTSIENKSKLLLLISFCFVLYGCPHIYFPYFRNYSDKPVELIFDVSEYDKSRFTSVMYKQEILPINKRTSRQLKNSIWAVMLPGNKVSFTIPANSTVLLPKTGSTFHHIILKEENKVHTISIWGNDTLIKHFQTKSYGFPGSFLYYYDYR